MKISILDQFAADAINAPAAVTGGGGKCGGKSKSKKTKSKSNNRCGTKSKSKKSKTTKNSCSPCPPPPCSPKPPCS